VCLREIAPADLPAAMHSFFAAREKLIKREVYVASMLYGLAGAVCNSLDLLGILCDTLRHETGSAVAH
jgi:hypothetical protein